MSRKQCSGLPFQSSCCNADSSNPPFRKSLHHQRQVSLRAFVALLRLDIYFLAQRRDTRFEFALLDMATPIQHASPQSNGVSPRAFAAQHARLPKNFRGCSRITDYDILGKLGEGTFGEVHRAKSKKTGTIVALKKILMHNEKDGFPITALREIKLLKLLSHPNVLKLEEMAVEHHSKSSTDKRKRAIMYMVTPYMDHDLSGLLENPSVKFTEPQIKCYMLQLLEGLRYLHDNKILHRDMKAANLLINNKGILQIADFGLARHYDEPVPVAGHGGGEAHRDYTTLVVTRWYRPPELLLHLRKYTTAIDLWGVGFVISILLVFMHPLIYRLGASLVKCSLENQYFLVTVIQISSRSSSTWLVRPQRRPCQDGNHYLVLKA